uniref:Uncharacterized protein n=1 Tax=Mustela putorius furo TaxID=9669 RepID=M3XNA0_MUSPF
MLWLGNSKQRSSLQKSPGPGRKRRQELPDNLEAGPRFQCPPPPTRTEIRPQRSTQRWHLEEPSTHLRKQNQALWLQRNQPLPSEQH